MKLHVTSIVLIFVLSLGMPFNLLAQESSADYCKKGETELFTGANVNAAITDLNHAIKLNPSNARAFALRGYAKSDNHDKNGAMADYNRSIKLDPTNADAYGGRGAIKWIDLDNKKGALKDFNQGIKLDPKSVWIYSMRARVKCDNGDIDGAHADFNRAIELDSEEGANLGFGRTLNNYGQTIAYTAMLIGAIENEQAYMFIYANRPKDAVEAALRANIKTNGGFQIILAHAYLADGQFNKAKTIYTIYQ